MAKKLLFGILLVGSAFLLIDFSDLPAQRQLTVQVPTAQPSHIGATLKLLSVNLAHGRKDGLNQLLQSASTTRGNLLDIATIVEQSGAHVVALQEADAPSRWSGSFDHVSLLARQAGYPAYTRSSHAVSWLFSYGTALLSRASLLETVHHTFQPSPPTMNKGFTLARIAWKPGSDTKTPLYLDIVSVHLDFSRSRVREEQIAELIDVLSRRTNPRVVLGDFNSDWASDEAVLRSLVERSGLQVYRPQADDLGTYNSGGRRLDWVLISGDLEFRSYGVLPDIVSDHLAVITEIGVKREQG